VNPELEARMRRLGTSLDAAAEAAAARRATDQRRWPHAAAGVSDLDPVDALPRRQPRFYRVFVVAAAAAAVAVGLSVVAARTSSPSETGHISSGDDSPVVEPNVADGTDAGIAPASTQQRPTTAAAPATSTSTATSAVSSSVVCPSYRDNNTLPLRLCDKGEMVRAAQQRLSETVAPGLLADGYLGPSTQQAVRRFQELHDLEADGLVGPNTWTALFRDVAQTSLDTPTTG
jgi:murein L,D-transpeptidase YcbB/YkuD